jgi:hypothetical protein
MFKLLSLSAAASVVLVSGHGRWKCPLPRDEKDENGNHITFDNTGNKYAACGPQSGKWGFGQVTTLSPGWTTFTWEESITHTGSPFRIAILDESETARVVLLDHIPHNEKSLPDRNDESTYVEYKISVNIPNVKCDKCSLQLLYVMTDKSVKCGIPTCYYNPDDAACKGNTDPNAATCAGAPNSEVCVAEGECFSNYHSCADVQILGTQPLSDFAFDSQPADWPYSSMKMQYYGAEVGDWSEGWLTGIPANYTTDFSSLKC